MFPHLYLAFRLYSFYLEILCFIITKKFYCFPADPLSGYDNRFPVGRDMRIPEKCVLHFLSTESLLLLRLLPVLLPPAV